MKKTVLTGSALFMMLLLLASSNVMAKKKKWDDSGKKPPFGVGSKTVGVFVGVGATYSYNYAAGYVPVPLPAFGVLYDQGIIKAGPGVVGIGGIVAAQFSSYKYAGYRATWSNYVVGVRGTWHLSILKEKNNKFDPYGGVLMGVRVYEYRDNGYNILTKSNKVYPAVGAFVGAKYNFKRHFGAFAELGFDITFLRAGLNFNF